METDPVRISMVSEPGSENVPNEDWAGVTPGAIVVLDGVTMRGVMTGACTHGTPWYVGQLGTRLLAGAQELELTLARVLARAINDVAALHRECDLASVGAPSAAGAVLRFSGGVVEYLVLADVTIGLELPSGVEVITDDRVAASVADVDWSAPDVGALIAGRRAANCNRPGGYWVAAADPVAASHAMTGSVPAKDLRAAAVMTDGAAVAVDMFGLAWSQMMTLDPAELICEIRKAERSDPERQRWPRWKVSDDATAVFWQAPMDGRL